MCSRLVFAALFYAQKLVRDIGKVALERRPCNAAAPAHHVLFEQLVRVISIRIYPAVVPHGFPGLALVVGNYGDSLDVLKGYLSCGEILNYIKIAQIADNGFSVLAV